MNFSLIVTDSDPLITLAIAGSLDALFLPKLPIIVPDMVRHEVIQDLTMNRPGAIQSSEFGVKKTGMQFTRYCFGQRPICITPQI